jgi:hypothetical protein
MNINDMDSHNKLATNGTIMPTIAEEEEEGDAGRQMAKRLCTIAGEQQGECKKMTTSRTY